MIEVETTKTVRNNFSQSEVRSAADKVARKLKIRKKRRVSLALVGDGRIRKLNKLYRGRDKVTDVLSFLIESDDFISPSRDNYWGEIIISYPQAVRQAKEKKWPVKKEISFLLIHGLLHLAEYEHEKGGSEAKKMEKLQKEILDSLG